MIHLVIYKSFAERDLDWSDVERGLTRQHRKLDLSSIRLVLKPLLDPQRGGSGDGLA